MFLANSLPFLLSRRNTTLYCEASTSRRIEILLDISAVDNVNYCKQFSGSTDFLAITDLSGSTDLRVGLEQRNLLGRVTGLAVGWISNPPSFPIHYTPADWKSTPLPY